MICIKIKNGYEVIKTKKNKLLASLAWGTGQAKKQVEKGLAENLLSNLKAQGIEVEVWITDDKVDIHSKKMKKIIKKQK